MTSEMIAELAKKIAQEVLFQEWYFYLLWILITGLSAFFGSWIKSYATDKAKFKSIEENFNLILYQLKTSTTATSEIQLALGHNDWTSREYKTLRRDKMESLMVALYETRDWVSKTLISNVEETSFDTDSSPVNKVLVISSLFFPELKECNENFFEIHQLFIVKFLETVGSVSAASADIKRLEFEFNAYQNMKTSESVVKAQDTIDKLKSARAELLSRKSQFRKDLLPIYRNLSDSFNKYTGKIQELMNSTISPI